jgi:DeoR/GlpR family transcriptional regulator of sugar metabolism
MSTADHSSNQASSQDFPAGRNDLGVAERRNRIIQMVNQDSRVKVADLSEVFGVSEVTVRNDLAELERLDLLERVHGGAVRTNRSYYRLTIQERLSANKAEKMAVAEYARTMVNEGDTIFLNSGTTSIYIARAIRDIRGLLVVTNAPLVAQELDNDGQCETVLVGGSYHGPMAFTYGDDAVRQISRYHAGKFLLSCDGVSAETGIMSYNTREADVYLCFMDNSSTIICVTDYSKIGRMSRIGICGIDRLDTLVTNAKADAAEIGEIRAKGVNILLVP